MFSGCFDGDLLKYSIIHSPFFNANYDFTNLIMTHLEAASSILTFSQVGKKKLFLRIN